MHGDLVVDDVAVAVVHGDGDAGFADEVRRRFRCQRRVLGVVEHLDRGQHWSRRRLIDDIIQYRPTADDVPEDHVFAGQVRCRPGGEEELTVVGVDPGIGHREYVVAVEAEAVLQLELIGERSQCRATGAVAIDGVAGLDDEPRQVGDAMDEHIGVERVTGFFVASRVEVFGCQVDDARRGIAAAGLEQFDQHGADRCAVGLFEIEIGEAVPDRHDDFDLGIVADGGHADIYGIPIADVEADGDGTVVDVDKLWRVGQGWRLGGCVGHSHGAEAEQQQRAHQIMSRKFFISRGPWSSVSTDSG